MPDSLELELQTGLTPQPESSVLLTTEPTLQPLPPSFFGMETKLLRPLEYRLISLHRRRMPFIPRSRTRKPHSSSRLGAVVGNTRGSWEVKVFIDVVEFCTFSTDHTQEFAGEVSICA